MQGHEEIIVIPILVVVVMLIVMIPLFIYVFKHAEQQRKIREDLIKEWNEFIRGKEIPPVMFNDIRQITLKQYMGQNAMQYECEGAFVIAIYDEKRFYYGESKKLFNSINLQLKGRGNKELFSDLMKNGVIWIRAYSYQLLSSEERATLKERLIKQYSDRGLYQYGKKKPVVEKPRKIASVEQQEVSYLNHRLSVTAMVGIVKQPRGGFINPSSMEKIAFESTSALSEEENVHPTLIGLAVDYLSRFMLGDSKDSAFEISLKGAELLNHSTRPGAYLLTIKGLDDESIVAAIKLVSYDCVYRAGPQAYVDQSQIKPTKETINNIREMVNRTVEFWKKYGPVTVFGPTFEGGYTNSIATGDGDYLSKDTIWDYKVSKGAPTSKHTLQLLLYYLLGIHSIHEEYKEIKYLGIYNPRLNIAYRYQLDNLSKDTIETIEKDIIGY